MEKGGAAGHPWVAVRAVAVGLALILTPLGAAFAHPDIEFLERAIGDRLAVDPDDPELLLRQGRLREMAKDWDGALDLFEHAREHGADPVAVTAARARVFLAAGFPRMAKREYDRVLALRPGAYEILFARGRAKLALGEGETADSDFAQAIARMSAPRPEHVIERHAALLARGKREEAVQALDDGIARLGPLATLELPAVELDIALERWDSALSRLDSLLRQVPSNPTWIARRADVLARAGRRDAARAERARALQLIESRPRGRESSAATILARQLRAQLSQWEGEAPAEPVGDEMARQEPRPSEQQPKENP